MLDQSTAAKRGKPSTPATCRTCGGPFLTWAYKANIGRGLYCSTPCYRQARRTGITGPSTEAVCAHCGQGFKTWPYLMREGARFCSPECGWAGQNKRAAISPPRRCLICGEEFRPTGQQIKNGQGSCCSIACRGIATKNGPHKSRSRYESTAYLRWRDTVRDRDAFTCQRCGLRGPSRSMHAHHIQGWIECPALRFEPSNGMTLCRRCHRLAHA